MRHRLYTAALAADDTYTATIAELFPRRTRWTLTSAERQHSCIVVAYNVKRDADTAWIAALRAESGSAYVYGSLLIPAEWCKADRDEHRARNRW